MKVTKKLWIAQGKRHGDSIYLYDEKLTAGAKGVYTGDIDKIEHYPASILMRELKDKDLGILGVSIKPGQSIEIEISYDKPREIGWYPVIWKLHNSKRLLHYDGTTFNSSTDGNATSWREDELSWIADEPIPDPFDIPLKPLECVKVTQREDGYYAATNRDRQVTWIIQSKDDAWYYYHGDAIGDTNNMKIGTKPIPKECLP